MWKFTSSCLYQVVRLLSRMMMQFESRLTRQHSSCHCHTEVKRSSSVTWRFSCTYAYPHCSLALAASHSDGPDDGNSLPSTVAWSLWVSTADKLDRFVFNLNNDCKMTFLWRLYFRTGPELLAPWWHSTAFSLLRECLLLLHWLLMHHSSFSQSCRPLLHLYDQVIPAVQDILRRIPERSESEGKYMQIYNENFLILRGKCLLLPYCLPMSSLSEVALEEICRSDGDEADDLDIDTVSWLTLASDGTWNV